MTSRFNYSRFLAQAALIAAVYTVLTLAFAPLSYGESMIQVKYRKCLQFCLTTLGCHSRTIYRGNYIQLVQPSKPLCYFRQPGYTFSSLSFIPYKNKWLVPVPHCCKWVGDWRYASLCI